METYYYYKGYYVSNIIKIALLLLPKSEVEVFQKIWEEILIISQGWRQSYVRTWLC